jgi:hypothetical protein
MKLIPQIWLDMVHHSNNYHRQLVHILERSKHQNVQRYVHYYSQIDRMVDDVGRNLETLQTMAHLVFQAFDTNNQNVYHQQQHYFQQYYLD